MSDPLTSGLLSDGLALLGLNVGLWLLSPTLVRRREPNRGRPPGCPPLSVGGWRVRAACCMRTTYFLTG